MLERTKLMYILLLLSTLFVSVSYPEEHKFGIGVIAGEPTGLSMKYWLNQNSGIDFAIAWSFERNASFRLHSDYLWHFRGVFKADLKDLFPYLGFGGLISISQDLRAGLRIPLGIEYFFNSIPLEIFLEIVPVINLFPATSVSGNAGIGIRYYF